MTTTSGAKQPMKRPDDPRISRQHTGLGKATKITKLALIATAMVVATIALAATANADITESDFQSPSGNIVCRIMVIPPSPRVGSGNNIAQCSIHDQTWATPALDEASCTGAHGNVAPDPNNRLYTVNFDANNPKAYLLCQNGAFKLTASPPPTLDYGQTQSDGPITCDSEPLGMTCTDTNSGHFFRVSRDSYQLG